MNSDSVVQSKPQHRPVNRRDLAISLLITAAALLMLARMEFVTAKPKLPMPEALKNCVGLWEGDHWLLRLADDGKLATGFSIPLWSNLFDYQVTEYTADEIVIDGLLMQKRYHLDVMPHITPDRHLEMTVDGVVLRRIQ